MAPTHFSGSPRIGLALDAFIKLTRAASSLEMVAYSPENLEGLTPSQFCVLEALYHLGALSQGELSKKVSRSTGNMTLVLDNLEKHGLAHRQRESDDRRRVTIHLTPQGELLIRRIFPQVAAAITDQMSTLSPEQQELLGSLCKKLGRPAESE